MTAPGRLEIRSTLSTLRLELDGRPLTPAAQAGLSAVRVLQRASLPSVCELTLLSDRPAVQPGQALSLGMGAAALFQGEVTAVTLVCPPSGVPELKIRAYDALHRLRKRAPLRARSGVRLSELAGELAASLGLSAELEDGLPDPVWASHLQSGRSDLELLSELAGRVGAHFSVVGSRLVVYRLNVSGEARPLTLGRELLEATVERNADGLRSGVRVWGWNPRQAQAVGGRVPQEGAPEGFGTTDRELPGAELDGDEQARLLAQAEQEYAAAAGRTLRGVAAGDPALRPGLDLRVGGLGSGWDGTFRLTAVTHSLDPRLGFLSELSSVPPPRPSGTGAAAAVATLGTVSDVQDPEGQGRVRVSLPAYGDLQGEWLPVVGVAAGPDKGLMALPDTGDQVLVLLTRGDPAQAVVLGGLYGQSGFTDPGVTPDGARRYTLRTGGGERLVLDGQQGGLNLQDRTGSTLDFRPDGVRLSASTDLLLEAPGRRIVIRADRIDFERG